MSVSKRKNSRKTGNTQWTSMKQSHELKERIKELRCLYGVANLLQDSNISEEMFIQKVLKLIPPAWQFPAITCSRIIFESKEYRSNKFRETRWKQSSDIIQSGMKVGAIEVYYLKKKPIESEGPFLREERDLIDALSKQIGLFIERKRADFFKEQATKFVSFRSHELKTPVVLIRGFSEFLVARFKELDDQKTEELLNIILKNSKRIEKLISEVNLMTMIQTGNFSLDLRKISPWVLLEEFFDEFKIQYGSRLKIPDFKALQERSPCHIQVDPDRLFQVFGNLLNNAQKFSSDEDGVITVKTVLLSTKIKIDIIDNGIGITSDNIDRIFDPFQTLSGNGSGIGLFISKRTIEDHNGSIFAFSQGEGCGTTITIELPIIIE